MTRYLGVAWEMLVQKQYLVPTLNFEPYFQKPPLLFWLIDLTWSVFGISRAAALPGRLCRVIRSVVLDDAIGARAVSGQRPAHGSHAMDRARGLAFALYSTLILFDMLLTALVLAAFLSLLRLRQEPATGGLPWQPACSSGSGCLQRGRSSSSTWAVRQLLYGIWRDPRRDLPWQAFFKVGGRIACCDGPATYLAGAPDREGRVVAIRP